MNIPSGTTQLVVLTMTTILHSVKFDEEKFDKFGELIYSFILLSKIFLTEWLCTKAEAFHQILPH